MTDRPTLHLTNWSSRRLHGPGRAFTIMARPRAWEWGAGRIDVLSPLGPMGPLMERALKDRRGGEDSWPSLTRYYIAFTAHLADALAAGDISALSMLAVNANGCDVATIQDGDTLCCACSVAESRAGRCHRAWAAPFLVRAGWRVVLDGVEVAP